MPSRKIVVRLLIATLACCLPVLAQNSATTAVISGTVRNTAGEVVAGATVTVRDLSTNQMRSTATDADGAYRLTSLAVSTYELRVKSSGFADYVAADVTLVLGQTTVLDVTLRPEGVNAAVEVSEQSPLMDATQTAVTTSVTQENVEELPVRDRNYLQFVLVSPGVAPSSSRTATGNAASANGPVDDSGFTFGGLRARSNSISIDGLTNIDETNGSALVALSPEIVREFQVVNNGISAEFGGAAGGTINVITKTGANQFHGTAFSFIQDQRLNARNPFDARRRLLHAYQPGFSLGGPLKKDKLFFYISAEQEHQIANDEPEISRSTPTTINSALTAGFAPRLTVRALRPTPFRLGRDQTELAGKLTWVFNSFNTANFRLALRTTETAVMHLTPPHSTTRAHEEVSTQRTIRRLGPSSPYFARQLSTKPAFRSAAGPSHLAQATRADRVSTLSQSQDLAGHMTLTPTDARLGKKPWTR